MLPAPSGTLFSRTCLPTGLRSLELVKFKCPLNMTLSMFGVKGKDYLLVRSLKVISVHLRLSLPEEGRRGNKPVCRTQNSHPLSAPERA